MSRTAHTFVGMSGWIYPPWRGAFYPKGLTQKDELSFASRQVSSIEINGTFYSLQRPASFAAWREQTPDGFVFSMKGGRYITHIRRLRDPRQPLANFLSQGVLSLGPKLGPILWQLPPTLKFDADLVSNYLATLPRSTNDAARFAKRHGSLDAKRTSFDIDRDRPLRHVMEVRNESFACPAFIALLRKHGVALCVADTAGEWPALDDVTSDFVYCRLHGDAELYVSGYTPAALDRWAKRIKAWRAGKQPAGARLADPRKSPRPRKSRDVFVYFDNDVKLRSPFDAMSLARRLGVHPKTATAEDDPGGATRKAAARTRWPAVASKK